MNFALYQAIKNELNLRKENKTGKLFSNQTTEQLEQLTRAFEKEIAMYMMSKTINYINKFERCGAYEINVCRCN